jgi:hypothetical protein
MNSNEDIRRHILDTYTYLRLGMAGIGIIFPLVLWWGGLTFGVAFQASISSYYHTPMRDIFVGSMITIGSFLWFYQGITKKENFALNCAGILAVIVALTPTVLTKAVGQVKCETFIMRGISETTASYIHGISAMLFFFAIAYVCIATSKTEINQKYQKIYNFLGAGMIVFPIASALLLHFLKETSSLIYFVELAAVWVFSAYWLVKTREINESQIIRKSLNM